MNVHSNKWAILSLLVICSSCAIYCTAYKFSMAAGENLITFGSFQQGDEGVVITLQIAWRGRFASAYLSSLFVGPVNWSWNKGKKIVENDKFSHGVGLYTTLWFIACCGIAAICLRDYLPVYIFALVTSVLYAYACIDTHRIYPWDMPAVFFFTLCLCLIVKNRPMLLIAAIIFGIPFKETVIVWSFAFFFWKGLKKKYRWIYFLSALCGALIMKAIGDLITHNTAVLITMEGLTRDSFKVSRNLMFLLRKPEVLPGINAGLLVAMWFLGGWKKHPYKIFGMCSIAFLGCSLIFSNYSEYRVFLELVPVGVFWLVYRFYIPERND